MATSHGNIRTIALETYELLCEYPVQKVKAILEKTRKTLVFVHS